MELKRLAGQQVSAGSIDVYKCFDQIVRQLLCHLARLAGMPEDILSTYEAHLEDMTIRLQVGSSLGEEHKHACSIPQGCPFSMGLVGLLMRPWIMLMREKGVEPRVLADDLFSHSSGTRHATTAAEAMKASRQYCKTLGRRWYPENVSSPPHAKMCGKD